MNLEPREWYSRDYLPHFDRTGIAQAVTFRLADSMPAEVLARWEQELKVLQEHQRMLERQKKLAAYLDAGHGQCWLRNAQVAKVVEDAFLHFDGLRYHLLAWVIMPNHVHLLVETLQGWTLEKVIQSWKTWTAKCANEILARRGNFWARDFHDRYIRDGEHFENAKRYIDENPVKAGLCRATCEWRWGSAWKGRLQ